MRTVLAAMGIVAAVALSASAGQSGQKTEPARVCTLNVSGMFCGACAKTVEKAVKKVDGVKAAKVSQPNGRAEITYDPAKTSPDAIAAAINHRTSFRADVSPGKEK